MCNILLPDRLYRTWRRSDACILQLPSKTAALSATSGRPQRNSGAIAAMAGRGSSTAASASRALASVRQFPSKVSAKHSNPSTAQTRWWAASNYRPSQTVYVPSLLEMHNAGYQYVC